MVKTMFLRLFIFMGGCINGYHFPDTGMAAEAGKVVAEADFVVDKVLEADMAFVEDKAGMEGIHLGAAAGLEKRYLA